MIPQIKLKSVSIFFCIALVFAGYFAVSAQYRFDNWTTDNGLPQNGVRSITQTPDGYLWFTTFDGLVRFDGVRFTTFNKNNTKGILNNRFTGLFGDKEGTLWATTMEDGTLTIYRNGLFYSFSSEEVPGHYINRVETDREGVLRFLVEDKDRTSKSWYYLREREFVFDSKQDFTHLAIEHKGKSGALWSVTTSETTELRDGKTTVYPHKIDKIDNTLPLFEDSNHGLWIGGVTLTRLQDGKIQSFGEKEGFQPKTEFHSFYEESPGVVWFANGGRLNPGLGMVRFENGVFTSFGKDFGLSDEKVFSAFRDREGTVWLATNKGLNRLRKEVIRSYGVSSGLNDPEVYPIFRDREDSIWIGTTKGLNVFRDGELKPVKLTQLVKTSDPNTNWIDGKMSVQSLWQDPKGKMWIGLNGGIFITQNGVVEPLPHSEGHHVFAIHPDNSGNVWAATNKGLLLYSNYNFVRKYAIPEGLPNEFMTVIFNDSQGRLWFGGFGGLSEFRDGKFANITAKEGLAGNYVRTIYEDKEGTLWIGTYDEGMSRIKDGKIVNFKEESGLFNSGVFAIREDPTGHFWISSNRGIYRVKKQDLNDFADGKIAKINSVGYGKEDGMTSTECNGGRQPASIEDKDGNFWFPTQDGVVIIDSKAERPNPLPPSVVIESVSVERDPIDIHKDISIEPGKQNIEIQYTGLSLIKSEQIKFKYKLEGHETEWVDAGNRRTVYYSYLPPGNYTFLVKAANSDGVWSEETGSIKFELKPYFYQTIWFIYLCVIAAASVLLIVWKISVKQLEEREKRLTSLVAERTAELNEVNRELQQLANSDGLTKIGNRRRFEEFLSDEWYRAVRFKTEISLILIDIDHFKPFNDTYGHQAGDESLRKVAEALNQIIKRPTDLVARFGGEEFAIILGGTDASGAVTIAEQAMHSVRELKISHGESPTSEYLTISLGVATVFAKSEMTDAELISAADKALYEAKKAGRNRIYNYDYISQIANNADILQQTYFDID